MSIVSTAAFIMPHRRDDSFFSRSHFFESIESIEKQSDTDWIIIIIDDYSNNLNVEQDLESVKNRLGNKVHLIMNNEQNGPGYARNIGIQYANSIGIPFVLFQDADDRSHRRRLEEVRRVFQNNSAANVVYSTFNVINEYGDCVENEHLSESILEILRGHDSDIVEGENAWVQIATKKNYTNLTSSTAVKTDLALKCPFPNTSVSEDAHTWLRYGAYPGQFVFIRDIPSDYRICSWADSASRSRFPDFYAQKAKNDEDGFFCAMKIATEFNKYSQKDINGITVKFYLRLSVSMLNGNNINQASIAIRKALLISPVETMTVIREFNKEQCFSRIMEIAENELEASNNANRPV